MGMTKLAPSDDGFMSAEGEPIFNSEGQGERSVELLKELVPYCPQGWQGFDYPEGSSIMQQGGAAMMITWSDVSVGIEDGPNRASSATPLRQPRSISSRRSAASVFSSTQVRKFTGGIPISVVDDRGRRIRADPQGRRIFARIAA